MTVASWRRSLLSVTTLLAATLLGGALATVSAARAESGVQAVYHFRSPQHAGHFYTISEQEKDKLINDYPPDVWTYEGIAWYAPN
jgi:hypothetical protein